MKKLSLAKKGGEGEGFVKDCKLGMDEFRKKYFYGGSDDRNGRAMITKDLLAIEERFLQACDIIEKLEGENKELQRLNSEVKCAYCGNLIKRTTTPEEAAEQVMKHIEDCPHHPYHKMLVLKIWADDLVDFLKVNDVLEVHDKIRQLQSDLDAAEENKKSLVDALHEKTNLTAKLYKKIAARDEAIRWLYELTINTNSNINKGVVNLSLADILGSGFDQIIQGKEK